MPLSVKLLASKTLHFPSASAIEYYQNKLYIFGDNATHLLILSPDYRLLDSVKYWKENVYSIEKNDKPDIESAMIVERDNKAVLIGVGSMSDKKRWSVIEIALDNYEVKEAHFFDKRSKFPGIKELNIEGSCAVGNTMVFANRANLSSKKHHLLFWNGRDSLFTKQFLLPQNKNIPGLSGLYYVKENDILLFTASEEETSDAKQDGAIGDSYLGWITRFSQKMKEEQFTPDEFLKLSSFDKAFSKQKIESVCAEKVSNNNLILDLVADNDNEESKIFKVEVRF